MDDSYLQKLLDKEASLSNQRYDVLKLIRKTRGNNPPPCFGEDDCSTLVLSRCPWRIDCGE